MKKAFFLLLMLSGLQVVAQRPTSELGIFGGGSYYLGDLNPLFHFLGTKPAGGLFLRYNLNQRWSVKLNGSYGTVTASDALSTDPFMRQRGLAFRSRIMEVGANFEFNFLPYITGDEKKRFSPYIFGGMALFHFNPQASLNNQWYDLQAVGTEGQGSFAYKSDRYKLTQISFPFGIGVKYSVGKRLCIGAEWGLRKTRTDYLDDVSTVYADPRLILAEQGKDAATLSDPTINGSDPYINKAGRQRGGSRTNDWYSFSGVMISFKLGRINPCAAYNHF